MRVQCHNVVNGLDAANRFSRRDPANPTGADRHNRLDERGGCGVPLRSLAGTESRPACLRWRQRYRTFLSGSSAVESSCCDAHEDVEKRAARVARALLVALAAYVLA